MAIEKTCEWSIHIPQIAGEENMFEGPRKWPSGTPNQIMIEEINWSLKREWGMGSSNPNRPMKTPEMEPITFTKEHDLSSISLYRLCLAGVNLKEVQISGWINKQEELMRIVYVSLKDAALVEVSFSPEPMTDNFTLVFTEIMWQYVDHSVQDGKLVDKSINVAKWNYMTMSGE